jgi:hypothetical protein
LANGFYLIAQYGQLGLGFTDNDDHPTPTEITFLSNQSIVSIVTSQNSNFARTGKSICFIIYSCFSADYFPKASSSWYVWGEGDLLVLSSTDDVNFPQLNPTLQNSYHINYIVSNSNADYAIGELLFSSGIVIIK